MAVVIGGAIWAVTVLLPDRHLDVTDPTAANWIAVASLALTGGFLGALIGALWRPPRLGAGLAGGIVAGVLVQAIVNGIGWNNSSEPETVLSFGVAGVAIAGLALVACLRSTAIEPRVKPTTNVPVADP